MTKPFHYLEPFRVAVCILCMTGVPLEEIPTHLRSQHPYIKPSERATILRDLADNPGIVRDKSDLQSFQLPADIQQAIPELGQPHQDGLGCTHCLFITRQIYEIQRHYRTKHRWANPRHRGRQPASLLASAAEPWRKNVPCQQIFRNRYGPASRFFEVRVTPGRTTQGAAAPEPAAHPLILLARQEVDKFRRRTDTIIQKAIDKQEPNLWLQRVRWADHLEGLEQDYVMQSVSLDVHEGWSDDSQSMVEQSRQQL